MGNEASDIKPPRLRFKVELRRGMPGAAGKIAEQVVQALLCDSVVVTLETELSVDVGSSMAMGEVVRKSDGPLFSLHNGSACFNGQTWNVPLIINDMQRARIPTELALELTVRKVRSCGIFPLISNGRLVGIVECLYTRSYHRWRKEELSAFQELAHDVADVANDDGRSEAKGSVAVREDIRLQYKRLARYGNVVILVTDASFKVLEVFGNTEQLVGLSPSTMTRTPNVWDVVLDPRDRALLRRRILRLRVERNELREEVRVVHQQSGEVRWMMLRALPLFSPQGVFLGWEGFGIDVSDRRRAQEALVVQNRRLEALFEVARALQGHTDAAIIVLKALRAVLKASSARSGYGCLVNRETGALEVVAACGLSEEYLAKLETVIAGPCLLRSAVDDRQGQLVDDLLEDSRAVTSLARFEGLRASILMPLVSDGNVYGAVVLFKKEPAAFNEADFDLVQAAASQIVLAVRQAEMFTNERRNGEALGVLYRLSRELAKYRSPHEIAECAFPLLIQEFSLKRGWFGVLNEPGTHVVGRGGFGPGVRRKLQGVQLELKLRHDGFDEAVRTQRPVLWNGQSHLECSGLNGLVERLNIATLLFVPLCSLGQVVGVLVVEPTIPASVNSEGRLQLLVSMANEMATVLMARKFESKMADNLKMRMAGLLAGGVAHNFNNLLQAVLGQVALIEMQAPKDSLVLECTKTVTEAAKRGANLVAQLMNFSSQNPPSKQAFFLERMLSESRELYESFLGKHITLRIVPSEPASMVYGDVSQLQQVVTNLLANAKDAVAQSERPIVELSTTQVKLRSGEVDPELAPGEYIRLDIGDNGVGMDAEAQTRCFEPFYTSKNIDQGTGVGISGSGLGLASAYSVVKQHLGHITVDSELGRGTLFSVYLPIAEERQMRSIRDSGIAEAETYSPAGALLLGWDSGAKPFVSSIFDSLGYTCRSAYDLLQVKELLGKERGRWEYVVIDVDALGPDILSDCAQLLSDFPELVVVVAAAAPRQLLIKEAHRERLVVLEKPLGVWSVERVVRRNVGVSIV